MENKNCAENNNSHKNKVHRILAHSYTFFLIVFLFSLFLHFIFPIKFLAQSNIIWVGVILLVLATILIIWAQKASRHLGKEIISQETFTHGPYCYTRTPTHWGLLLLVLGFGIIANSLLVIVFTVISFFIAKIVFIKREEKILAEKYGAAYLEYKKSVKF